MTNPAGKKDDGNKVKVDLIDPLFTLGIGRVLTHGATKYAPHNWRMGMLYSRLIAAAKRHLLAIECGQDYDPDTGELHVYHLACETMFLARFQEENRKELDDRQGKLSKAQVAKAFTFKGMALTTNQNQEEQNETTNPQDSLQQQLDDSFMHGR